MSLGDFLSDAGSFASLPLRCVASWPCPADVDAVTLPYIYADALDRIWWKLKLGRRS
jgi:hypothetical protein